MENDRAIELLSLCLTKQRELSPENANVAIAIEKIATSVSEGVNNEEWLALLRTTFETARALSNWNSQRTIATEARLVELFEAASNSVSAAMLNIAEKVDNQTDVDLASLIIAAAVSDWMISPVSLV